MNRVFSLLFISLMLFSIQAHAQTVTINFQASGLDNDPLGTFSNPDPMGTLVKNAYPSISNFGGINGGNLELSSPSFAGSRTLRFRDLGDYIEFGPFPGGMAASQFTFTMFINSSNWRRGTARVAILNSSKQGVGSDSTGQFFEVRSDNPTANSNQTACVLAGVVPAGGYIFLRRTSAEGNGNNSSNLDGDFYIDNIVFTPTAAPVVAGVIDFQHSSVLNLNGTLDSYSSPTTRGTALKGAYPIISNFGGVAHTQGITFPSTGGLELGNHNSSHMMMFEHPRDFIELGPFPLGVPGSQVLFTIFAYNGSTNYTKGRIRATILNSSKQGVGSDSSGTFFETSSTYYTTSTEQTLCIVPAEIPAGGYIQLRRVSLYGNGYSYDPNGNFWIDDISFSPNLTPVELLSFRSYVKNGKVDLHWKTATELNNYGFEIERSGDKQTWTNIGFVNGHGTSMSPKDYSFTDEKLDVAVSVLYYRLKQIDRDGTTEYSTIVSAELGLNAPASVGLSTFPQPFANDLSIKLSSPNEEDVVVTLFNSALQKISVVYEGRVSGTTSIAVNTSSLLNGMYFLITETTSSQPMVQRIVKMNGLR